MHHHTLVRALIVLALAAPISLGGCDKIKELTGGKESAKADKDDEEDEDDDKKDKKKKKKKDDGDKKSTGSSKPAETAAPVPPPAAAGAAAHLPDSCEVALNVNVNRLANHPAIAKEVMPLLDELLATPSPKDDDFKRFQTFMKSAGLTARSFHNLAGCVSNIGKGRKSEVFGFAVGGDLKPDSIMSAFEKVREASGKAPLTFTEVEGKKVLTDKDFALGQFPDGVLGAASSVDIYKRMLKPTDYAAGKYRLDMGKDLSFGLSDDFIAKELKGKGGKGKEQLEKVKKLSGFIDLSTGTAMVRIGTASAQDAKELDAFATVLASEFKKKASSPKLEDQLLSKMTNRIEGTDLIVEVPLPADTLNKAATMLADELRKSKGKI
jgi:hypothetical protein